MSFKAYLEVAGKKYNILNVNYSLAQETDLTGRPSAQIRGGRIEITIESGGDTEMFEWMTNSFERKDGKVVFVKRTTNSKLKELQFTEGYVVKYRENFEAQSRNPFTETFLISSKIIRVGNGEHVNDWV